MLRGPAATFAVAGIVTLAAFGLSATAAPATAGATASTAATASAASYAAAGSGDVYDEAVAVASPPVRGRISVEQTAPHAGALTEYAMQAGGVVLAVGATLLLIRRKRRETREFQASVEELFR